MEWAICTKRSCDIVFMKMKVIWFCLRKTISGSYLKQNNSDLVFQTRTSKFVACRVTKMWFLKLWITSFWTQALHFNFKKILKKWCGNVYSTSERNYKTFNKIQAKSSFGRHVGGQEYALQHGGQYKSYCFVEKSKCHKISPLNAFPLEFQVQDNFCVLCQFLASARLQLIV